LTSGCQTVAFVVVAAAAAFLRLLMKYLVLLDLHPRVDAAAAADRLL
jgi:hypothetical protein